MEFANRIQRFGDEIFASLNEKRLELERQGKKIYNLSIGTPDFTPPEHIMEALIESAKDPASWKYSLRDIPELLDAVCEYYQKRFGVAISPDQIMSCYGTQEGTGHLCLALLNPGDTILLPDPCYPVFQAGVFLAEAEPWYYPLTKEHGFLPWLEGIPEEVAKKAKAMIVNLPANPVGSIATPAFYEKLVAWAKANDILIIHDNAYSDIIFSGTEGKSFLGTPEAMDVGVEFFSLSKSFNVTGARISFLIGRRDVIQAVKLLRSQIDFGMFLPIQKAAVAALKGSLEQVKQQCKDYEERRDALCGGAREIGWNIPDADGSMFVWAPIPESYAASHNTALNVDSRPSDGDSAAPAAGLPRTKSGSSMDFCMDLLNKAGVLCTPGSSFGPHGEGYVRFALVLPPDQIKQALAAVKKSGILG